MAAYTVAVPAVVEDDLANLHPTVRKAASRAIARLGEDPRPTGSKHIGHGKYRLRIRRDYRIVYAIDDEISRVRVLVVARRERVYDIHKRREELGS